MPLYAFFRFDVIQMRLDLCVAIMLGDYLGILGETT